MTFLGWISDPFQWLSDLQLGYEKVTLNHLEMVNSREFQHLHFAPPPPPNQTNSPHHFDSDHLQGPTAPWCVCLQDLDRSGGRRFSNNNMDLFEGIFLRILPYGKSSLLYCHIWENMFFFLVPSILLCKSKTTTRTTITTTGTGFSFFLWKDCRDYYERFHVDG